MDLNRIALWFAAVPALTLFWRSVRGPRRSLDWLVVSVIVLSSAALGWVFFRDGAGFVATALLLLLFVIPASLSNAAARASERQHYGRAHTLSRLSSVLHPVERWRVTPRIYHAFQLAQAGQVSEAEALLQVVARGGGEAASMATAHRLRILGRWRELKGLGERQGLLALRTQPTLMMLYLRALGELGYIDDLARFMLAQETMLAASGIQDQALLYLFSFTGQRELTEQVLLDKANTYSAETRDFWLAIASQSAGQPEEARRAFGRLRASQDAQVRTRAEERYANLSRAAPEEPPSPQTLSTVAHFARGFAERQRFALDGASSRAGARLTSAVALVNVLVYLIGSAPHFLETRDDFSDRWAFFAPAILSGQWLRVLSYLFVHQNWLHLVMNLGGLFVLGPFVERAFGRARFAAIYFVAGCAGSAAYLILSQFQVELVHLVGASGCIMGLLGANAAVMLRVWLRHRLPMARQIFLRLLVVVALQVTFDYTTPQVAGLAHGLGLLGGFLGALCLEDTVSSKSTSQPRASATA
ncbi:MAG TPA: rhomboid family intramembrane serine protease [Polyangiaceae bacterium]|nr:rhomboid family intramembrane serine protease [Polyangiaceae bacterium]